MAQSILNNPGSGGGIPDAATRGNALVNRQALAGDGRSLEALRLASGKDPKTASKEAARQFEALFLQQVVKSMRAASEAMGAGGDDGNAGKIGADLLDSQLTQAASGKPGGLADLIQKQLERSMGLDPGPAPRISAQQMAQPAVQTAADAPRVPSKGAAGFVKDNMAAARRVEARTGIPAAFMVAQAALETGWGSKGIVAKDGTVSNNLFGIKAGGSWSGPTVDVATTEYMGGHPRKVVQKFRAYASTEESMNDYARLITGNRRYAAVVEAGGDAKAFAQQMQRAGYATDPAYGSKLARVIETTRRLERGAA